MNKREQKKQIRQIPLGRHRVSTADALKDKERIDQKRLKVLEKLASEAQELGLGY